MNAFNRRYGTMLLIVAACCLWCATGYASDRVVFPFTQGSGEIVLDPPGGTYENGATVTMRAQASPGWTFSRWVVERLQPNTTPDDPLNEGQEVRVRNSAIWAPTTTYQNPEYVTMKGMNAKVTAYFERLPVDLVLSVEGEGSVVPSPTAPYLFGDVVSLTAVPAEGWEFVGWSGALSGGESPATLALDDHSLVNQVTATFQRIAIGISTHVEGAGSVGVSGALPYYWGDEVTLTALPATGWEFSHWSGSLAGTTNPAVITLTEDVDATAHFIRSAATLDVSVQGNGDVQRDWAGPYVFEDEVILTAVPAEGWEFAGWSGALSGSTNPATVILNHPSLANAVTATFQRIEVSLTVDVEGEGSVERSASAPYYWGDEVALTAVAAEGWQFAGWSGALSGATNPETVTLAGLSTSVTAVFERIEVSLAVDVEGEGSVERSASAPYYWGDEVALTAVAAEGWQFAGWSGALSGATNPETVTLAGLSTSVTAVFERIEVSLTVDVEGEGSVEPSASAPYYWGDEVALTAVAAEGWQFVGWSGALEGNENPASRTLADLETQVTAIFGRIEVALTTATYGSGVISVGSDAPYYWGDEVILAAVPAMGWEFVEWTGAVTGVTNPVSLTLDDPSLAHEVVAVFQRIAVGLSVDVQGNGTVDVSSAAPYYWGDAVTLAAQPAAGWRFAGWSGAISGSENPVSATLVNATTEVVAVFERIVVAFSANSHGSGTVEVSASAPYYLGDQVTVTAVPAQGWEFTGWSGALSGTSNPAQVTLNGDAYVTATFARKAVQLTLSSSGQGAIQAAPAGPYYVGDTVTLTAEAAQGWSFTGWSGGLSGSTNPRTITLTGNLSVMATFAKQSATLTTSVGGSGSISRNNNGPYYVNDQVTLTAQPASGWQFVGWTGAVTGTQNPATVTLDGADVYATAIFVQTNPGQTTLMFDDFSSANLAGWISNGWLPVYTYYYSPLWSAEGRGTNTLTRAINTSGYESITVSYWWYGRNNTAFLHNVYAEYTTNYGASWTAFDSATGNFGWNYRSFSLPAAAANNSLFGIRFRVAGASGSRYYVDDVRVTGAQMRHTLSTGTSGNGYVWLNPGQPSGGYAPGTSVQVRAQAKPGWTFSNWSGALSGSASPQNVTMDASKSVTATFVQNQYTLNVGTTGQGNVSVSPQKATYTYGEQVTLTATPATGWKLGSWSGAIGGAQTSRVITITGNTSVTANFTQAAYWVTTSSVGNGSVILDPPTGPYLHGATVQITAVPGAGWNFASWSGGLSGSVNPRSVTITGDLSVLANFTDTDDTLSLSVQTTGSGSVSVSPSGPYPYGTVVELNATPNPGWELLQWTGDASGSASPLFVTMNANKSIGATFVQVQYGLNTSVQGNGSINVSAPGPYYYNDVVTLTASAAPGWEFANWSGTIGGTENPVNIVFTEAHNVTAVFKEQDVSPVEGYRVLVVGDSWAGLMWAQRSLRTVFQTAGFNNIWEKGDVTAIGGTTASWWAQPANLALITNELAANPTIDIVHLSMGGNDFLAGQVNGGWYKGMGAQAETAFYNRVQNDMRTVVDYLLNYDPTLTIVFCSYDYLNMWDTVAQDPQGATALMWANLGQPSPRELNEALIELGERQRDLAVEYGGRVAYVNNWGLMHQWFGYGNVFGPDQYSAPWGHPSYPGPQAALANNGSDAIHLNETGYQVVAFNMWMNFYRHYIDPSAGPRPIGADEAFPPPPPPAYQSLFYDDFENHTATTNNWILSNTSFKLGDTLWGAWSLELDSSDWAIRAQNTSGHQNIKVSFWKRITGYDLFPVDTFRVEYTTNNGVSWTSLESWTSNSGWTYHEYLLPAAAANNPQFGVRFRAQADSSGDDAFIDEFRIESTPIPCTLHDLNLNVNGTGHINRNKWPDYGSASYCAGTQVTLTAVPKSGWTFTGWSGGASGTTNPITVTMNQARTITATFVDSAGRPGLTQAQLDWTKGVAWNLLDFPWPDATASQRQSLHAKAEEALNVFETYHMPYGQAADVWYTDYTRSQVAKYETVGDSALFVGYYLAALCNKYAVTGDSATLTKINSVIDTIDFLTVCTGKTGYIARFAAPANDPAYQLYYEPYGPGWAYCAAPWQDWVWLDHSSRDTYTGVGFGLANVWIHVNHGPTRAKAQAVVERVLDRLIADSWNITSPTGKWTNWTPGVVTLWQRMGLSMNNAKYGSQYNYGTWFYLWRDTDGMEIRDLYFADYFANMLTTMQLYAIRRLETAQDKIDLLNSRLLRAGESRGGSHLNAHFAACYVGGTGDAGRQVPRGVLQGGLIDFESGEQWMKLVDQSNNPAYPKKDADNALWALLVRDRPGGDYIWQRSAARLKGGHNLPIAYMSLDQVLPYWMGRESGAIPAP